MLNAINNQSLILRYISGFNRKLEGFLSYQTKVKQVIKSFFLFILLRIIHIYGRRFINICNIITPTCIRIWVSVRAIEYYLSTIYFNLKCNILCERVLKIFFLFSTNISFINIFYFSFYNS